MMAVAKPQFALRPYLPPDAPMLADIFRASVEELTQDDYTPAQQEAWASFVDDMEEFAARLADRDGYFGRAVQSVLFEKR